MRSWHIHTHKCHLHWVTHISRIHEVWLKKTSPGFHTATEESQRQAKWCSTISNWGSPVRLWRYNDAGQDPGMLLRAIRTPFWDWEHLWCHFLAAFPAKCQTLSLFLKIRRWEREGQESKYILVWSFRWSNGQ